MGLLSDHFQQRSLEKFGHVMTESEVEDRWARGYPVPKENLYRLPMRQHPQRTYRIVIIDHVPAIIARCTVTKIFKTIF